MDCSCCVGLRGDPHQGLEVLDQERPWIAHSFRGMVTIVRGSEPLSEAVDDEVAWKEHASFRCHVDSHCNLHRRPLLAAGVLLQGLEPISTSMFLYKPRRYLQDTESQLGTYRIPLTAISTFKYGHSLGRTNVSEDHKQTVHNAIGPTSAL